MPQSMPLLRPGPTLVIVEQPSSATREPAEPAVPVEATFVGRLLTGWSVESAVIDAAECLTEELTQRAADQGHGLVAVSVSFADRRLRVTVVGDQDNADTNGRWFELSRGPAGAGAQPEPAVRFDLST